MRRKRYWDIIFFMRLFTLICVLIVLVKYLAGAYDV